MSDIPDIFFGVNISYYVQPYISRKNESTPSPPYGNTAYKNDAFCRSW